MLCKITNTSKYSPDNLSMETFAKNINIQCMPHNINNIFLNKKMYEIYHNNSLVSPNLTGRNLIKNKLNKLNTCINCEFAAWTQEKLIQFIETFRLLYNLKFYALYNFTHRNNQENRNEPLKKIANYTLRFIDVLLKYVSFHKFDLLIETDLMKSLISFYLKINIIKNTNKYMSEILGTNNTKFEWSDNVIIRSVLKTVNSIQSFIFQNCNFPSYNYDNKLFFGYSKTQADSYKTDIDTFFDEIKPMISESLVICNTQHMLLLNIIQLLIENNMMDNA